MEYTHELGDRRSFMNAIQPCLETTLRIQKLRLHPLRRANTKIQPIPRPPSPDLKPSLALIAILKCLLDITSLVLDLQSALSPPFEHLDIRTLRRTNKNLIIEYHLAALEFIPQL